MKPFGNKRQILSHSPFKITQCNFKATGMLQICLSCNNNNKKGNRCLLLKSMKYIKCLHRQQYYSITST